MSAYNRHPRAVLSLGKFRHKRFGRDVLLFGNEAKLREAVFEKASNETAFEDILKKRFVHSAHLLKPDTLVEGLKRVLANAGEADVDQRNGITWMMKELKFRIKPRVADELDGYTALELLKLTVTAKKAVMPCGVLEDALVRRITQSIGELRAEECADFAKMLGEMNVKDRAIWRRVWEKARIGGVEGEVELVVKEKFGWRVPVNVWLA
jgi:hypothetical protein